MEVSELAEELKRLQESARHEDSHSSAMIFESKARNLMGDHFDTILSALQTVAGIERLYRVDIKAPKYSDGMWDLCHQMRSGRIRHHVGHDLHSAVSAAVEQIEKGK